jgi:hypothetical protein
MFFPMLWNLTKTAFSSIQPWKRCRKKTYKKPVAHIAQTLDADEPCSYLYMTPAPTCVYITRSGIYMYTCIHVYIHTVHICLVTHYDLFGNLSLLLRNLFLPPSPPPLPPLKTVILSPGSLYYSLLYTFYVATHTYIINPLRIKHHMRQNT